MLPAKEVGGDLYDFVLLGEHLYFCVGDVSGKGVPASLVMAQTTRLFRSLSTQEKEPAQIAQIINAEMMDNQATHGMFVTMFIGLLNLRTGLTEAENADLQQFGEKRMLDFLRHTKFTNSRQVIETMRDEVEKNRNGKEPNDDLTMLCLSIDY